MSISRGGEKFQAPLHKIESRDRPSGQIPNLIVKQDVSKGVSMQILFHLEMKINNLRTKIFRLKIDKEKLREIQLLVYMILAVDTAFTHSKEKEKLL